MIAYESSGVVRPPNIMQPRQRGLTFTPVRPRLRYSIRGPFRAVVSVRGAPRRAGGVSTRFPGGAGRRGSRTARRVARGGGGAAAHAGPARSTETGADAALLASGRPLSSPWRARGGRRHGSAHPGRRAAAARRGARVPARRRRAHRGLAAHARRRGRPLPHAPAALHGRPCLARLRPRRRGGEAPRAGVLRRRLPRPAARAALAAAHRPRRPPAGGGGRRDGAAVGGGVRAALHHAARRRDRGTHARRPGRGGAAPVVRPARRGGAERGRGARVRRGVPAADSSNWAAGRRRGR